MVQAKNWAITDLSQDDTLVLTINGNNYEVTQFTMSFAVNEIPRAMCMVAIGRDANSPQAATLAQIHNTAATLRQMFKATIQFHPQGEYTTDGTPWPPGAQTIFTGYFVGFAYRKVNGRVVAVVHLVHRCVDLGYSSTLSRNSHPSNPTNLTFAAVVPPLGSGAGGEPIFISEQIGHEAISDVVGTDLWGGIKGFLWDLANVDSMEVTAGEECLGPGTFGPNTRAQRALSDIEGPAAAGGSQAYNWGVALPLQTRGVPLVEDSVATAINMLTVESVTHQTFWDVLVGGYCPMFAMAFVPRVTTDLVIADTPMASGTFWRTLTPDDYDAMDFTAMIERPLRGIAVYGDVEASTKCAVNELSATDDFSIGGCFVVDSVDAQDGMVQYIPSPAWLKCVTTEGLYAGDSTGVLTEAASRTETSSVNPPAPPDPLPSVIATAARDLYGAYAQSCYVANTLRGRSGALSGRLRFDIAPGSNLQIIPSPEKFIGAEDSLVEILYGNVARVTVAINIESLQAGTSFQLTHLRSDTEDTDPRTSVTAHPLFGTAYHGHGQHGAPLVDAYALPPSVTGPTVPDDLHPTTA